MSQELFSDPVFSSEDEVASATTQNLGVAFGLVVLSGGATAIGAAVVYIPSLVNLANSKTLAISLGLSAGVMIFVSFVEIFAKSQMSFAEAGFEPEKAYALAMGTFFAGAVLMLISHYVLDKVLGAHGHDESPVGPVPKLIKTDSNGTDSCDTEAPRSGHIGTKAVDCCDDEDEEDDDSPECRLPDLPDDSSWGAMMLPCCDDEHDPKSKLDSLHNMAKEMQDYEKKKEDRQICLEAGVPQQELDNNKFFEGIKEQEQKRKEQDRLMKVSLKSAVAIGLHNFPEGLATFVAALGDPKMGVVLAIGIAIHNIPEGLAVALPLYYATGNRTKAFLVASLSGFTEIFAALLGWAVLASAFSATLYAVVFGIVSGMMVIISIKELLPTAHRYDPEDKYVTISFVVGMIVMALSLALVALV